MKGRVAAFEILVVHSAVANLIREKKTYQLPSVIQTGKKYGMITMNESLMGLVGEGFISLSEAYSRSVDKQEMNSRVNGYLLEQVRQNAMSPMDAVKASYFRLAMIELLNKNGFGRGLKDLDMSALDMQEEVVM